MLKYFWVHRERPPILSKKWFKCWIKRIYSFPRFLNQEWQRVHLKLRGARIGEGTVIVKQSSITGRARNVSVGSETFLGRILIAAHGPVIIGCNVCINDGAKLLTASHDLKTTNWRSFAGEIIIDDFAWIATDAIILPGVRIGKGAVVGAGAVVARNVPDFAVAIGNPAQVRENARERSLDYSPVRSQALSNAWLGS